MTPTVSIVIPTHNRSDLLHETLASVKSQAFDSWEALIVDDHSTDETRKVVASMAANDTRVRYRKQSPEKRGAPAARNTGLNESKGAYILFLDSDDLLLPDCLARRVEALESRVSAGLAASLCIQFKDTPDGTAQPDRRWTSEPDLHRFLRFEHPWHTGGVLWRRDTLDRIGGWNEHLGYFQDWELSLRALAHGTEHVRLDGADWGLRRDDRPRISSRGYRAASETTALIDAVAELKNGKANAACVANYLPSVCMTLARRHALAGYLRDALHVWFHCWWCGNISFLSLVSAVPLLAVSPLKRCQTPFQWLATRLSRGRLSINRVALDPNGSTR